MSANLGLLLSDNNARRQRKPMPLVDVVLLERTLFEPPRASAAGRWATQVRRLFPNAEVIPYGWHLLTHGPDDGLRGLSSRSLEGQPHKFGGLQSSDEVARAWEAVRPCYEALGAKRIVIRTPASLTPGAVGRKRLQSFVEQRRADGYELVWEPEGLWSPSEAANLAASLKITAMGPAFVAGRPNTDEDPEVLYHRSAWLRVDAMGRRPRLSADQLDAIADHADVVTSPTFVFAGPKALANLEATADSLGS
ncbi:MAG: hypothetical protein ACE37F_03005 [Nannocystaceae bacterium]|nr:hypothetical protein [bacterium]